MKLYLTLMGLIIILLNSAFQCNKCVDLPDQNLDDTRRWLPLKGKTQLDLYSTNGTLKIFKLFVVDTIETNTSCTGNIFKYEYIAGTISLDTTDRDIITFAINPPNNLCVRSYTNTSIEVGGCEIFSKSITNGSVIMLTNFRLRTNTYAEIALLKSTLTSPIVDSIIIAKNFGVVGFKYKGENYAVQ